MLESISTSLPSKSHPSFHFTVASAGDGGLGVYDSDGEQIAEAQLFREITSVAATAPADGETYYIVAQRPVDTLINLYLVFSEPIPPDEFESNQNRTTAELVTVDEKRSGVVSAGDRVDWFAIESGPGPVEVTATLDDRSADNLPNLDVGIYDPNGTYTGTVRTRFNRTKANVASTQFRVIDQTEGPYYI
jgi:hypothetical protein